MGLTQANTSYHVGRNIFIQYIVAFGIGPIVCVKLERSLMWLFLYKGHRTNKIRKTDKTKEIILWLSHLTADLKHIDNKNLKKKHYLENVWNHDTCNHLIISAETNKGLLNTQTSAVQISFE